MIVLSSSPRHRLALDRHVRMLGLVLRDPVLGGLLGGRGLARVVGEPVDGHRLRVGGLGRRRGRRGRCRRRRATPRPSRAGGADDAAGVELPEHAATIAARATAARSRAGAVLRSVPFTMTFLLLVLRQLSDGRTPRRDSQPGSKSRNTPFRSNGCARAAASSISMPMPGRDVGRTKPSTTSGSSGAISRASGTASSTKVSSISSPGSHAASSTLTAVADRAAGVVRRDGRPVGRGQRGDPAHPRHAADGERLGLPDAHVAAAAEVVELVRLRQPLAGGDRDGRPIGHAAERRDVLGEHRGLEPRDVVRLEPARDRACRSHVEPVVRLDHQAHLGADGLADGGDDRRWRSAGLPSPACPGHRRTGRTSGRDGHGPRWPPHAARRRPGVRSAGYQPFA